MLHGSLRARIFDKICARRRQIKNVPNTLPIGLQQNRKRRESRCNREQIGRTFPCCHSGARTARAPFSADSRARPAASRNFAANREVEPIASTPGRGIRVAKAATIPAGSTHHCRECAITNPSSDHIDSTSRSRSFRSFAVTAMHHGACTRVPNGVSTQTRRSPIHHGKSRSQRPGRWALELSPVPALPDTAANSPLHSLPGCAASTS